MTAAEVIDAFLAAANDPAVYGADVHRLKALTFDAIAEENATDARMAR